MKKVILTIVILLLFTLGCGKINDVSPQESDLEDEVYIQIEKKYDIELKDKNNIKEILTENSNTDNSILSISYVNNDNSRNTSIFDLDTKKELGVFALKGDPIIIDLGYGDKKEITEYAIYILNKTSTHIYGYIYYIVPGDYIADGYRLFSSKIGTNKGISDNLFGNHYYFWSASGTPYNIKPWYDNYILIQSNSSYPDRQTGYYIIGNNHEIAINGSSYKDYSSGLNHKSTFTYDKTVVIISNDLAIYDLQTNKYTYLGLGVKDDERLRIENIAYSGNLLTVNIAVTSFSGKVLKKTIEVDLESLLQKEE